MNIYYMFHLSICVYLDFSSGTLKTVHLLCVMLLLWTLFWCLNKYNEKGSTHGWRKTGYKYDACLYKTSLFNY